MMSEKQERQITFTVTEEYIARYLAACDAVGIHGVGSLINLNIAKDCEVTVYPDGMHCSVHCDTEKKHYREVLWYDQIPVYYEFADGVLLRINENTALYLPITADKQSNKSLNWMRRPVRISCGEVLTVGLLRGVGIDFVSRLRDGLRYRRSFFQVMWPMGAVGAFPAVLGLVMGIYFCYGAWEAAPVPYQDTVQMTAVFREYDTVRYAGARGFSYASYIYTVGNAPISVTVPRDEDALKALPEGTEVHLALHPRTEEALEMRAEGKTLIAFDAACEDQRVLSIMSSMAGCIFFAFAAWFGRPSVKIFERREKTQKRSYYDMKLERQRENKSKRRKKRK